VTERSVWLAPFEPPGQIDRFTRSGIASTE